MSCGLCFYERCDTKIALPNWPRLNCDIAHIAGEKPTAARYVSTMTDEERRDYPNLMLLCPNHHRVIDALEVEAHPIERLREMKEKHEQHCVDTKWWPSEEMLDHYVDLLIEDAASNGSQSPPRGRPELRLQVDEQTLNVSNVGTADALQISMEPIGGSPESGNLIRLDEAPARISPGGNWNAGLRIQTFQDDGPKSIVLRYSDAAGNEYDGEFPV